MGARVDMLTCYTVGHDDECWLPRINRMPYLILEEVQVGWG